MSCLALTFVRKIPGHNARVVSLPKVVNGDGQLFWALGEFSAMFIRDVPSVSGFSTVVSRNAGTGSLLRDYDCKQRYLMDMDEVGWGLVG